MPKNTKNEMLRQKLSVQELQLMLSDGRKLRRRKREIRKWGLFELYDAKVFPTLTKGGGSVSVCRWYYSNILLPDLQIGKRNPYACGRDEVKRTARDAVRKAVVSGRLQLCVWLKSEVDQFVDWNDYHEFLLWLKAVCNNHTHTHTSFHG